jgi:hypothetical protein
MQQVKIRPVRLTLLTSEDVASLSDGQSTNTVRMVRMARMVREAIEQGACLTRRLQWPA